MWLINDKIYNISIKIYCSIKEKTCNLLGKVTLFRKPGPFQQTSKYLSSLAVVGWRKAVQNLQSICSLVLDI